MEDLSAGASSVMPENSPGHYETEPSHFHLHGRWRSLVTAGRILWICTWVIHYTPVAMKPEEERAGFHLTLCILNLIILYKTQILSVMTSSLVWHNSQTPLR